MPSEIKALTDIDYMSLFISIITIMAGWVALKMLLSKFLESVGVELPWVRKEREQNERIDELKTHMTEIDNYNKKMVDSIDRLENMVTDLSDSVKDLGDKQSASERARLKDRILQSYQYYKRQGHWTSNEREALLTLIESYRQNGETNTFVNETIAVEIDSFIIQDH